MKKLTSVLSLIVIITVVACIVRDKESSQNSNKNLEPNVPEDDASNEDLNDDPKNSEARIQKMFKDLGMTQDQQRRYKTDYQKVMAQWERENPNKTIDDHEKTKQLQRSLNAILDEAQYSIYREWSKNNS